MAGVHVFDKSSQPTGQVLAPPDGTVTINEGRAVVSLRVTNHADRPIQVTIYMHHHP